jgi:L-alanine-DL-glutamate epimerase-like enolase superfamily enzyme
LRARVGAARRSPALGGAVGPRLDAASRLIVGDRHHAAGRSVEDSLAFVADSVERGFRTLKAKVGGRDLAADVALLRTIHSTFPALQLVLDGNCAYDLDGARELLRRLAAVPIAVLEQPLPRHALHEAATLQVPGWVTPGSLCRLQ